MMWKTRDNLRVLQQEHKDIIVNAYQSGKGSGLEYVKQHGQTSKHDWSEKAKFQGTL